MITHLHPGPAAQHALRGNSGGNVYLKECTQVKYSESIISQTRYTRPWGPFLERPGNLTGPKSYFEIKFKVSRKVGRVLTFNEVNFLSLADIFTVQFSNLLKLPSAMENKTA